MSWRMQHKNTCQAAGCVQDAAEEAEAVVSPEDLQRRKEEAEEEAEELPEGFHMWQEVVASQDLNVGDQMIAAFGTPGVIIGKAHESRIRVKFDERLDGCHFCVDASAVELMPQLPASCGVAIGQRVFASVDLFVGASLVVRSGTRGTPLSSAHEGRIQVAFDERADGRDQSLNVLPHEIQPLRKLAGCFEVGDKVKTRQDLKAGDRLLVKAGTNGVVVNEYSPSRVNVKFDETEPGVEGMINVTPSEIERFV
eukprot:CAMPEP_0178373142 /NCGR_PEP_ID=MMETSP0689_2-20121128/1712_1 /TAXON_ID=160604 /ORGANISM="Amphidinium massartii, Strain CS-259" /LENGTH=252 /DNA_ID=CAMNT_0019993079 /DNA_START=137 /DNA_END=896 /DNA_ORIENTATION=+